ncbi:immunoglobulin-like domain-containing protein [Conexibacter stalactiti]|uniref:Immunoglobulin-like domain-containing protein n=1 Tax=Conexibacter stalactiti TaxID=1940611 RepID=A0ABU4HQL5_9ACTN|nr:immunoglobulin-like domain-containing protein [Conexibacter stalactiti]MDW5594334.1 immunoglobulin-like domain-containing protein [Conexibacter stalactiti]MEC5034976.1 immunoglobulin-like domain-containing protein [Conexibacter stalactiti]
MSFRPLGAALVGVALLPAAAVAAPRHQAVTPRQAGVQLSWPSRAKRVTLAPGATVSVTVRSLRRRSAPVTVTLARTDGVKTRVVKRRTLRRGSFAARLPAAQGARYVLSARIGRRIHRRLTIVTPPARPRHRGPIDGGFPLAPTMPRICPDGPAEAASGTLTGGARRFLAGQTLSLTFTNTGPICLSGGISYVIERNVAGSWQRVDLMLAFPALFDVVQPGATRAVSFTMESPAVMPSGSYRLVQTYSSYQATGAPKRLETTWEFDVAHEGSWPNPDSCGEGVGRAEGSLDRTIVANGGQVELTIRNSGSICLLGDDTRFGLEREIGDGRWEDVPLVFPDLPPRSHRYEPGRSLAFTIPIYDAGRMPLGRYRVSYALTVPPTSDAVTRIPVTAEFDVVAPPD